MLLGHHHNGSFSVSNHRVGCGLKQRGFMSTKGYYQQESTMAAGQNGKVPCAPPNNPNRHALPPVQTRSGRKEPEVAQFEKARGPVLGQSCRCHGEFSCGLGGFINDVLQEFEKCLHDSVALYCMIPRMINNVIFQCYPTFTEPWRII